MSKNIKGKLGSDGYYYPITSYDLVVDENGESVKTKLSNIGAGSTGEANASNILITDAADNFTSTNVEGALAELFQYVSNGKTLVASAITDKGINTLATDTFQTMATNIRNIVSEGGGTPTEGYSITNILTNTVNNKNITSISPNASYIAKISAESGFTLDTVLITMGGVDITNIAYNTDTNIITIEDVTGNIVITATSIVEDSTTLDDTYNYFVFDTTLSTSSNTVTLKDNRAGDNTEWDGITDWGDGTSDTEVTHTYATNGTYTVKTKYMLNSGSTLDSQTKTMLIECLGVNKNITDLSNAFRGSSIVKFSKNKLDFVNITNLSSTFNSCKNLITVDANSWDVKNVTNFASLFQGCSSLTSLDLSGWDVTKASSLQYFAFGCSKLEDIQLANWNVSGYTNLMGAFRDCSLLTSLDLSGWNTASVTRTNSMFQGCTSLSSLDISNFNMDKVTNNADMFTDCNLTIDNITMTNCNETTIAKITELISA